MRAKQNPHQPSLVALIRSYPEPKYWPVWLLVALMKVLSWLPMPVPYCLGSMLGELAYWLSGSRRAITKRNLAACFPDRSESEINTMSRKHFRCMVAAVLVSGIGWWASPRRMKRLTRVNRPDILDRIGDPEDRMIFLAPHFAALEYGGLYLALYGLMTTMYQRNRNPLLNDLVLEHRNRFGGRQFGSKESIKGLIRETRMGRPFYYLPDQDPGRRKGIFAPFFGISTATFPALGRIAGLSRAEVIPFVCRMRSWGRGYEIIFDPPLENYPCGDDLADTTAMNRAIEKLIEHAPEQYLWSHKRFKTRPEGEAPFY